MHDHFFFLPAIAVAALSLTACGSNVSAGPQGPTSSGSDAATADAGGGEPASDSGIAADATLDAAVMPVLDASTDASPILDSAPQPHDGASTDAPTSSTGPDGGCVPSASLTYEGGVPLGCVTTPSACCYPDGTNTGVPPGTHLTPSGSMEIMTDGTVISGLDVTGTIDVYANNVTIMNTRVTVSNSGGYAVYFRGGYSGSVIHDTTIRGQDNDMNSVEYAIINGGTNPTRLMVQRVDLSNCSECIFGGSVTMSDSYLHDTADPAGAHVEDVYGYSDEVYTHNTILNPVGQTAAVYMDTSSNCTVDNNLLAGGGYTIYGGSTATQDSTNVVITNNRFSRSYYPNSGYYGIDAYYNAMGPGDSWTGNFWDDTGGPVIAQ